MLTLEHEDRFLRTRWATKRQQRDVLPAQAAHAAYQALGLIASDLPHAELSGLPPKSRDGRNELISVAACERTIGVESEAE